MIQETTLKIGFSMNTFYSKLTISCRYFTWCVVKQMGLFLLCRNLSHATIIGWDDEASRFSAQNAKHFFEPNSYFSACLPAPSPQMIQSKIELLLNGLKLHSLTLDHKNAHLFRIKESWKKSTLAGGEYINKYQHCLHPWFMRFN